MIHVCEGCCFIRPVEETGGRWLCFSCRNRSQNTQSNGERQ